MKTILIVLCALFIIISCIGCSLYSPYARVTVKIPELPPAWKQRFAGVSFCIEYLDPDGNKRSEILPTGEVSCTIRLPKIRNWPVIGLPNADGFPLPPAGGLYPWHLDNSGSGKLLLSWEHGFTASLLKDCFENGYDISLFNAIRLSEEVPERSGGDPWRLDYSFIAEKIMNNSFRVNYLTMLPCADVEFLPGAGKWFFQTPFSQVYEVEQNELFCFENIPLGFHRLFHYNNSAWYEMYVTVQETVIVYYGDNAK